MSHINYNHLYYFWHVYREGSVVGAAEALYLTPQTITGQIKALEERLQGKLFKRKGRGLEPSELGELVFRYADRMFTLSQEMLDIVNYRKESNLLFGLDAISCHKTKIDPICPGIRHRPSDARMNRHH